MSNETHDLLRSMNILLVFMLPSQADYSRYHHEYTDNIV